MHGVRLTLAYDGSAFCGWARQPGQRTVQGVVETAIAAMAGVEVDLRGASRTDAGVHAEGQEAAFDSPREIPPHGWLRGLNASLPDDVAVVRAHVSEPGYSPRFDASEKTYRYLVLPGDQRAPLLHGRVWFLGPKRRHSAGRRAGSGIHAWLDLDAMREAASHCLGTHDFRAFRAADDSRLVTIRHMFSITLEEGACADPRVLAIHVRGNAFMKNMVRILSGTLVDVGRGRIPASKIPSLLGPQGERKDTGMTAPAHGLTLMGMRLGRRLTPGA